MPHSLSQRTVGGPQELTVKLQGIHQFYSICA